MEYKITATANGNVEVESTSLTIGEGVYKFDLSFIVKGKKYRIKNRKVSKSFLFFSCFF